MGRAHGRGQTAVNWHTVFQPALPSVLFFYSYLSTVIVFPGLCSSLFCFSFFQSHTLSSGSVPLPCLVLTVSLPDKYMLSAGFLIGVSFFQSQGWLWLSCPSPDLCLRVRFPKHCCRPAGTDLWVHVSPTSLEPLMGTHIFLHVSLPLLQYFGQVEQVSEEVGWGRAHLTNCGKSLFWTASSLVAERYWHLNKLLRWGSV